MCNKSNQLCTLFPRFCFHLSSVLHNFLHETSDFNLGFAVTSLINSLWVWEFTVWFEWNPFSGDNTLSVEASSTGSIDCWDGSVIAILKSLGESTFLHAFKLIILWIWVWIVWLIVYHSTPTIDWVLDVIKLQESYSSINIRSRNSFALWEETFLVSGVGINNSLNFILVFSAINKHVDIYVVVSIIWVQLNFFQNIVSGSVKWIDLGFWDLLF